MTLTKGKIDAELRRLNKMKSRIEDEERLAENSALVGRYFKYRNSYSSPRKESDYWWLYGVVESIDRAGYLTMFEFQIDGAGRVEIERNKGLRYLMSGWVEISECEFNKEWKGALQSLVTRLGPRIARRAERGRG